MSLELAAHDLLTPAETAELLRVGRDTLLDYARAGRLEVVRLNSRTFRYPAASVAALMAPDRTRPPNGSAEQCAPTKKQETTC
jgi:excisionase family DNA binding protein